MGAAPVFIAAVGPRMTEVAGEVCDGMFVHAFSTPSYLRDVTLPALTRGRAAGGKDSMDGFTVAGPCSRAWVAPTKSWRRRCKGAKQQIAFYASTPAYRAVLEHHGWGDLQPELTRMSKEGKWKEMGELISDDVLHEFAAVGSVAEVASQLRERWAPLLTRLSFYIPYASDDSLRAELLAALS